MAAKLVCSLGQGLTRLLVRAGPASETKLGSWTPLPWTSKAGLCKTQSPQRPKERASGALAVNFLGPPDGSKAYLLEGDRQLRPLWPSRKTEIFHVRRNLPPEMGMWSPSQPCGERQARLCVLTWTVSNSWDQDVVKQLGPATGKQLGGISHSPLEGCPEIRGHWNSSHLLPHK